MVGQQGKFFISKAFKKFDSIFITLRIHNFQNNMKEKHKKVVNGWFSTETSGLVNVLYKQKPY